MKEKEQDKFWELATAKLHKEATPEELLELKQLLLKDVKDDSKKTLRKIEKIKKDADEIKGLEDYSQSNSWSSISSRLRNQTITLWLGVAKYAAIIVFALFLGNVITTQWNNRNEIAGFAEVSVPLGQMSEMTLFDGTRVWLNSGTTLRYNKDFGKTERKVSIEGEAFFDVTYTGTPFKVEFKAKEVEVLGTQFNVVAYSNDNISRITLVEGKVNVNNESGASIAQLKPSQQLTINEISKKASIKKVDTNFYVSWTEGKIVFDDEILTEICAKLERWYNVDIQFKDKSIGELSFSGTILKNKPFDQIITAFELLLPIEIEHIPVLGEKDKVIISKKI